MAMIGRASRTLALGLGTALVACAEVDEADVEPRAGLRDLAVPPQAAGQVEDLTALRASLDEDGDGFVSPLEAEGYYRRYFDLLDDDNDGRLSRAELKPEAPGSPDLEVASEELVGWTEQEYVDEGMRKYNLRADRAVGMMSTREFDELIGERDAAISTPRPELLP